MEIKFNSVEEVLEFASRCRPTAVPGQMNFQGIDPNELAATIGVIATNGRAAKIKAIKLYCAVTGVDLKGAKAAIERNHPFQLDIEH